MERGRQKYGRSGGNERAIKGGGREDIPSLVNGGKAGKVFVISRAEGRIHSHHQGETGRNRKKESESGY